MYPHQSIANLIIVGLSDDNKATVQYSTVGHVLRSSGMDGRFLFSRKERKTVDGFIEWFTNTIRSILLWEIAQATATMQSAYVWMALFNVLLLVCTCLIVYIARKAMPIAITIILGMFFATVVTVALIK